MILIHCSFVLLTLLSNTNGDTESTSKQSKQTKPQRTTVSEFWKNHRLSINTREGKSNNEPFFSEPNNNDHGFVTNTSRPPVSSLQYESMPNTIQITALPSNSVPVALPGGISGVQSGYPIGFNNLGGFGGIGGLGGIGGAGGVGGVGGWHGHSPWPSYGVSHGHHGYGQHHQRPIYLINKRVDWFSWFIPLLFLLGAPLLLGIVLIPVVLKSIIFLLQILRNLGILLPITAALSGNTAANLLSQQAG